MIKLIKKTNYGFLIENNNIVLHIAFYSHNTVRFVYDKSNSLPDSSFAVVKEFENIEAVVKNNKIITKELEIVIDKNTMQLLIYNKNGELLNKDKEIDLENIKVDKELLWEKGFYGLGEKYSWINHLGARYSNWNTDVLGVMSVHSPTLDEYHTSIPFYIGLDKDKSYGIYFDNTFKTYFDFGNKEREKVSFGSEGGKIDYYFIYDENVSQVVNAYTKLTGNMELPRKDFLGFQQCRWGYENRDKLMEVACRMREENIPCDVLYLDIDYMVDYKVFTVDTEKFYEFKEMVSLLNNMGYKLVVIIDPGVKAEKDYFVYDEGIKKDYFIKDSKGEVYVGEVWPGASVFPDFLKDEVRKWWGELHKGLIEDGVEGIWNDMNEPADFKHESKTIPTDTIHIDDNGIIKEHKEIHNLYAMYEAYAAYEGLLNQRPEKRPFILTRAAFAGTQRYSALWTGDNHSIWEHMEASIPMFINLGLSGYSFIGSDVGGFAGNSNGELLARWTQLGTFTPLFRNHSAKDTIYQEPWSFDTKYTDIIRRFTKLRYKFITYLYNLMRESCLNGSPVIRPLFYHYQYDEKTYNINDQFLFGKDIMVCPILRPGIKKRMVYVPDGIWYNYWTKEKINGNRYIIADAPLDVIPLYVRAGGVISEDEVQQFIKEDNDILNIHIYIGEDTKAYLYFDDGISFNYRQDIYSEIEIKAEKYEKVLNVSITANKDNYKIPKLLINIHGLEEQDSIVLSTSNVKAQLVN